MTTDREPKSVQIPAHWQFRERGDPDLDVLLCEPDLGLLEFQLELSENSKSNVMGGGYIFDRLGKPTHALRIREHFAIEVYLPGELSSSEFILHMAEHRKAYNLIVLRGESLPEKPAVDWDTTLTSCEYASRRDGEGTTWGELEFISLTTTFDRNASGKTIFSPPISLFPGRKMGESGEGSRSEDWRTYGIDSQYWAFSLDTETPTSVLVTHKRGKNNYRVSWEIENGVLTVTQHHLGLDIKKVVSLPLTVNITNLVEAAFFPTERLKELIAREGQGTDIPWKNFDRLVGCRLGYIYPLPAPTNTGDLNYKPGIV